MPYNNYKNRKYILVFLLILFLILVSYLFIKKLFEITYIENFNELNDTIPKKIWVFWDKPINDLPNIIYNCYQIMKKKCPNYEFYQLNLENYKNYVDDNRVIKIFENDKLLITHKTDTLRLYLMCKYGGFWLDSSILLLDSLDWIYEINKKNDYDIFMFKSNANTTDNNNPMIENSFIASKPNQKFNELVYERLIDVLNKPNLEDELNKIKADKTVNYQNIFNNGSYLIAYFIYTIIIAKYKDTITRMKFLECNDYKYACLSCNSIHQPIIDLFNLEINDDEYNKIKQSKIIKIINSTRKMIQDLHPINNSFIDRLCKEINYKYKI